MPPKCCTTRNSKKQAAVDPSPTANVASAKADHSMFFVVSSADGQNMQLFSDHSQVKKFVDTSDKGVNIQTFPSFEAAVACMQHANTHATKTATITPDKKKPASKKSSARAGVAAKPKSVSDAKSAKFAHLSKSVGASAGGKPFIRMSYFPSALGDDQKIPVVFELIGKNDLCYWLFKPDMLAIIINDCYDDDPISSKDFFNSLMEGALRCVPFGDNFPKQTENNYNTFALISYIKVSSMRPDFPHEMEEIGKAMKGLFADGDFQEFYRTACVQKQPGLKEYLENQYLWNTMNNAMIHAVEKDHLDAMFLDSTIVEIMDHLFGKAPNMWSDDQKCIAYHSEEIPNSIM